jgi:stage II sporulation protein AA (anti-sigma F factor antagonist)
MNVVVRKVDDIAVIEPEGAIDTRSAPEFEKAVHDCLNKQATRFIIAFGKVDLISSVGLRILVMLAKRVSQVHGGLVLCGLSEHLKTVFEVTGLTDHFTIVEKESDAVASVGPSRAPAADDVHAKLSDMVARLVSVGLPSSVAAKAVPADTIRALAEQVGQLLTQHGRTSSDGDPAPRRR